MHRTMMLAATATAALSLMACGGGGGGGGQRPKFTPTPTPPPTPPPPPIPGTAPVKIFNDPKPGNYASVGVSISASGGNLDTFPNADASFGPVSAADSEQAHIRYTADGHYEIQMPGTAWDRLVHYGGLGNPTSDNNYFQPQSVPMNQGYLITANAAKSGGYSYSEIGTWGSTTAGRSGSIAFGVPTPAGGVPVTGSATFEGLVQGTADVVQADYLYGGFVPISVDGTVSLNFNFASGTLSGEMSLFTPDGMNPLRLGTFTFTDTVYSVGSTSYSGRFATSAAGDNFFLGRFTGPNATETIGAWAVPFVFQTGSDTIRATGQTHQAFGAWIARRP